MEPLSGSVAVVTGAGSGIGRAIALRLASAGASLLLVGRDPEKLRAVEEELRPAGGTIHSLSLDLTRPDAGAVLGYTLAGALGRVDILVHSAGIFHQGSMLETAPELLREQLESNVIAPYVVTRTLLPLLVAGSGQIVFINSSVVAARRAGVSAYAASKRAMAALADGVREEVNPLGVRVLSVYLGRTATPMQARVHAAEGREYEPLHLLQPDDVAAMVMAALSLPRSAEVTDLHIRPLRKPR
jgi:NADP-dependent 3-hydroxy acid dehydrogenase YdfG